MKKILCLLSSLLVLVSCFDDSKIWDELNEHESRLTELERACQELNENIVSLQAIVTAIAESDCVTGVTPILEGETEVGYEITFSQSAPIKVYHGINGQTPLIGIKADENGVYYWTLNEEWILDAEGHKMPVAGVDGEDGAAGEDGANAVTPKLKIEEDYWYVSYDDGATWSKLEKAAGKDGDSFFKEVVVSADEVKFTFADGRTVSVPLKKRVSMSFNLEGNMAAVNAGEMIEIKYTVQNGNANTVVSASSDGNYKVKVVAENASAGKVYVTAPDTYVDGFINVLLSDGNGSTYLYVISIIEKNMTFADGLDQYVPGAGGEFEIPLLTNFSYNVQVDELSQSWIRVLETKVGERVGNIKLWVEANSGEEGRAGSLIVYAENSPETPYCVIIINQGVRTFGGDVTVVEGEVESEFDGYDVVSTGGESEITDGQFDLNTYENDHVQTYMVADENENVYMLSRASRATEGLQVNARTTALSLVTMHPVFAPMAAADYETVVAMVEVAPSFPALLSEVEAAIAAKKHIFDKDNNSLLIALSNVMEEISGNVNEDLGDSDFSESLGDVLAANAVATRALYDNPDVYPFHADITGNTLTLRNIGLTPSYYGQVVAPDGSSTAFSVPARADYGGMDAFSESLDEFMLGDPRTYTFTTQGKYSFYLSRMNASATFDFYLRLANAVLTAWGLEVSQEILAELANEISRAMINAGSGVNDQVADPMDWLGIAYDAILDWMQKDYWEDVNKGSIIKMGKLLSGSLNFYNKIKGTLNGMLRMIHAVSAPEDVNFSLCWQNEVASSCSGAMLDIVGGDGQVGYPGQNLFEPLVVQVQDLEDDNVYRSFNVKFEVVAGSGSVEQELVAADGNYQASTYWKLGSEASQQVRAVVVDVITGNEISEPVYFDASTQVADITIRLDWNKHSGNTDIDLHVVDPSGEEIYYRHMNSASGGWLDRDDTVGPGPEHIRWEEAPAGTYKIYVHYYPNNDPDKSIVSYKVSVTAAGVTYQPKTGSISYNETVPVGQFTIGEAPATRAIPALEPTSTPARTTYEPKQ